MDFTDLQMILTAVVILTVATVAVFIDQLRKLQPQRAKSLLISPEGSPLYYAPAKKRAADRLLEPLIATATSSWHSVQPRVERETVTVQMASPSPSAPSETAWNADASLPAFTIDAALWERLISSLPQQNLISSVDSDPTPFNRTRILGAAKTVEASYYMIREVIPVSAGGKLPCGMIQQPVLEELLEREDPFTGLVVSIGINDSDSSMWHSQGLMQSVGNYITGLLKDHDFCCRTAYDEFVMVCSGEQGAHAQRRLNHISERLWDYQLRGIGACSILFSWGGVQVQDQPLADAVASATERMRETKRSGYSAKAALAHRQPV
jgi:hypothetical protein